MTSNVFPVAGIAAAPLLLAGFGLTHPAVLTPQTASYYYTLHLILLVLFPLLGVNLWWLLSGVSGGLAWAARVLSFIYILFYGALDVLAGLGTGAVVLRSPDSSPALDQATLDQTVRLLFNEGNALSLVGVWAFLIACLLTSIVLLRHVGRFVLPGAVLLCGAAVPFLISHIYWPLGVATMLVMAAGFALLMLAKVRQEKVRLGSRRKLPPSLST